MIGKRFLRALFIVCLSALMVWISYAARPRYVGGAANGFYDTVTPAEGAVFVPIFVIDFPDEKDDALVRENNPEGLSMLGKEELSQTVFKTQQGNFSDFVKNASYGKLSVTGEVSFYTAKQDMAYYEYTDEGFEILAMEVLDAFSETIDFSLCDANADGVIDVFVLSIVGADDFWYGCQATWWYNEDYLVQGLFPGNYIINDALPLDDDWYLEYYVSVLCHEFGHCLGLPDLYQPEKLEDYEAMTGIAGSEMMEDMTGDYSQFSKLMIGWVQEKELFVYKGGTMEYTLRSAAKSGDCILIPRDPTLDTEEVLLSEYFLIEYDSADGNYARVLTDQNAGVRVLHADAETMEEYGAVSFKYNMFSPYYHKDGSRMILSLAGNQRRYLRKGDVWDFAHRHITWYDTPDEALPYVITVTRMDGERAVVRISD